MISDLPAGEYLLSLQKVGYLNVEKSIKVVGDTFTDVEVEFVKPASLHISSQPPNSTVNIQGQEVGKTPLTVDSLYPERTYLQVSADGYKTERRYVNLKEAIHTKEHFELKKLPSLQISSEPSGARVYINENFKGMTPIKLNNLQDEYLQVSVKKKHYKDWSKDLALSAGKNEMLNAELHRMQGHLEILTEPEGAEITSNGEKVGETPYSNTLYYGEYDLTISHPKFKTISEKIELETSSMEKNFKLEFKTGTLSLSGYPPGASVFIDGNEQNNKTNNYELPVGEHQIEVEKPGYQSLSTSVNIQPDRTFTLDGSLDRKNTGEALLRSIILPGWGQAYQGKNSRSVVYPMLFIGAAAGSYFWGVKGYNSAIDDYDAIRDKYLSAFEASEINSFRQEMHQAYDDIETKENLRNMFFMTAGAIWLWNVLDALILPPGYESSVRFSGKMNQGTIKAGISLKF